MDLAPSDESGPASANMAVKALSADRELASTPPEVAADSDQPGTILSIQILRFVAALCVVVFHAHNALTATLFGHQSDKIDRAFQVGASGVHIFFVISGFVMVYTSWRSQLTSGNFLSRRLVRIYPIYWVLATMYVIAHLLLGTPYHLGAYQVFGAALLLPGSSSLVIGPGWTLSFEMYFYICFALALFIGLRRGLLLLSVCYVFCTLARLFLVPQSTVALLMSDSLLLEFVFGAWLGYAFAHGFRIQPRLGGALIIAALALFSSGAWLHYERLPPVISSGIPSLLLVTGGLTFEPWLRFSAGRKVAKLGDSSYLLYLSHILIIDVLIAAGIGSWNSSLFAAAWLTIPIAAICTIAAAIGYEVIELPLLNILKTQLVLRRKNSIQPASATP